MSESSHPTMDPMLLQRPGTLGEYAALLADAGVLTTDCAEFPSDLPISFVSYDSRQVHPGTLFICKGAAFKEDYLVQAQGLGAVAYVAERPFERVGLPCLTVRDVRAALAPLAARAYGYPARDLAIATFTGTKGKTTCAFYLKGLLDAQARVEQIAPAALISTILVDNGAERIPSLLTSPEPLELNLYLASARARGATRAVMESSSQALKYGRVAGITFEVGAFTNISEDHISPIEHPTFEDYFASKLALFAQCRTAVVNLEMDCVGRVLEAARVCERTLTYALNDPAADVYATSFEQVGHKTRMHVVTPRFELDVIVPSTADFNLSNALGALAAAEALGLSREAMRAGMEDVRVPGRMEHVDSPDPEVVGIVDYAHNEVSLRALLANVRRAYPDHELTVVFGSTGVKGRDRREGMGRAAGELADRIIATEDDAGTESVMDICRTIERFARDAGASDVAIEPDRERAVRMAVSSCSRPAVIVLAGKGHERKMIRPEGKVPYEGDSHLFERVLAEELGEAPQGSLA
ncbi:MAG: UDP-N-acetylmuramyl-tripeptide synthetase [Coriobacteriaceae bacterium]|nr:UDP-N-acetylmuramyl-tripeptide synthetase [Coriobacteriaceae bacterium]